MAWQPIGRGPELEQGSISRALFEASDAEAQRAATSCRWMLGCHLLALFIVALLTMVSLAAGIGGNNLRADNMAVVNQQVLRKSGCLGNTIWCFAVVTSPEEQKLLEAQAENNVGIYECDAHTVFQKPRRAPSTGGSTAKDKSEASISIWEEVKGSEEWMQHDWTVKVDADLVFFPSRLKQHIDKLCAPRNDVGVYLKNTDFKSGFLGSLEVFSKEAMRLFSAQAAEKCSQKLGRSKGEDSYMRACMDAINVGSMSDTTLLDDQYTRGGVSNLGSGICQSGTTVGFHPFKTEFEWESCHDAARRISDGPNIKCLALTCNMTA